MTYKVEQNYHHLLHYLQQTQRGQEKVQAMTAFPSPSLMHYSLPQGSSSFVAPSVKRTEDTKSDIFGKRII